MEAKDEVIMGILTNAFGSKVPVGAFRATTDAYKAGIREVVEWGNAPCPHKEGQIKGYVRLKRYCYVCWQAKLKEWGINEAKPDK